MSRRPPSDAQPQDGPDSARPASVDAARLVETCVELADTLAEDFDLIEFLHTLVERCVELLDVSAVGLMLGDGRGRLRVMASSAERMRLLELFQLQNDQGPCLECYRAGEAVDEPDLAAATDRWPLFAPEAVRAGMGAVHALPMRLRTQTVGALNLFHVDPGGLREEHTRIAQGLVDVATVGLVQVQLGHRGEILLDQLQTALDVRVVVEQAKGIVAEHRRITTAEAFALLRRHSVEHRIRLTDLALAVINEATDAADLLSDRDRVEAEGAASARPIT